MKKLISIFLILLNLTFVICHLSLADEYRISPNDTLEIKVINHKELDTKQSVVPDGTISLPLAGRENINGKSLSDLDKLLKSEFSKYISNPQVVVYLTPRPIYVVQHDLKTNTWDVKEAKSVDEARALAGGNYADQISN